MGSELFRGWRPYSDNAAIAARAYQSLSLHPPLVGMSTVAGNGHALFDPGPLLFYLLALPVHIDPSRGLFWGAVLLCGAVLSVAIEAAWSAGLWVAGAVLAFTTLDLLWLTPKLFENLPWNTLFPIPFFMAGVVLAWVVALGQVGWWPVLVFVASVAAQSHLTFVLPSVVLTLLALAFGLLATRRTRRLKWLGIGIAVGCVCWLAPVIQEMGSGSGNLSALARSNAGEAPLGLGFALRLLGAAGSLHPLWLTHLPTAFFPLADFESGRSPWIGAVSVTLIFGVTAAALATGRRRLGALGAVTLSVAVSEVVTFAVFPADNSLSLSYLMNFLWVISILMWSVVVWAGVMVGQWAWRRYKAGLPVTKGAAVNQTGVARLPLAGVAVSVAFLVLIGYLAIEPAITRPYLTSFVPQVAARDDRAALAIERIVRPGPVAIMVRIRSRDVFLAPGSAEAVAYRLKTDGWQPGLRSLLGSSTGFTLPTRARWPTFLITMKGNRGFSVTRVR